MTPTIAILCLLAGALFARQLFAVLKIGVWAMLAFVGARYALAILPALDISSLVLGAFGAGLAVLIGYRAIHNALVRADLARTIERDKAQAKARLI